VWYIHPTEKWIEEVVRLMNEQQLKPEHSRFMIAFFSSLDNEYVDYFKNNKDRISSFSSKNFHIFTPLIYEGNIIPVVLTKGEHFPEPIDNLIRRLKYVDFSDESKWDEGISELRKVLQPKGNH
jgi:hypothetical protein